MLHLHRDTLKIKRLFFSVQIHSYTRDFCNIFIAPFNFIPTYRIIKNYRKDTSSEKLSNYYSSFKN